MQTKSDQLRTSPNRFRPMPRFSELRFARRRRGNVRLDSRSLGPCSGVSPSRPDLATPLPHLSLASCLMYLHTFASCLASCLPCVVYNPLPCLVYSTVVLYIVLQLETECSTQSC